MNTISTYSTRPCDLRIYQFSLSSDSPLYLQHIPLSNVYYPCALHCVHPRTMDGTNTYCTGREAIQHHAPQHAAQ